MARHCFKKVLHNLVAVLLVTTCAASAVRAESDADHLDALRKVDSVYGAALTLTGVEHSGEGLLAPGDPGGPFEWQLTRNRDEVVLHRTRLETPNPHFVPQGQSPFVDYDENGNMISPFLVEEVYHFSPEERFCLQRYNNYLLSPDGSVLNETPSDSVEFFQPDDPDPSLAIKRALWSVGRGFSPFLEEVLESESRDDGQIALRVRGYESRASRGIWRLVVAPSRSYLVTEAAYTRDGRTDPTIELKNTGLLGDGSCEVGEQVDWTINVGSVSKHGIECRTAEFRVDQELLDFGRNAKSGPFVADVSGWDKRSGRYRGLDLRPKAPVDREPSPPPVSQYRLFAVLFSLHILVGVGVVLWYRKRHRLAGAVRKS